MGEEVDLLYENGIDITRYVDMQIYYKQYIFYQDRINRGENITEDDREAYDACAYHLNAYGVETLRYLLNLRVCVNIDNKEYIVGIIN